MLVRSDIGALLGMAPQIPAGRVSGAGKQRADAGLRLGRTEDELGLAIFLEHRVVARDRDLPEGLAIRRYAIAEHSVIHDVGKRGHGQRGGEPDDDESLQEMLDSGSQRCTHGVPL
jgi:hypothetical protein